jgi:hypothetical protein
VSGFFRESDVLKLRNAVTNAGLIEIVNEFQAERGTASTPELRRRLNDLLAEALLHASTEDVQ